MANVMSNPSKMMDISFPEANGNIDAFGRLRVSEPYTIFDSKQIFDLGDLFFDNVAVSGSGTSGVYDNARASTTLGTSNLTAGRRVFQTKRRFNYQPGKSQLVFCTFVLGATDSGTTKRVGFFDDNNGIFLESVNNQQFFVIRSSVTGSPVDTRVNINDGNFFNWNETRLDFTKSQILIIDYEWLGVGSVRIGFVLDGKIEYFHQFNHANNLASVYMSTPNLPVRYELTNDGTGAAHTLESICSTVMSEGGVQGTGLTTGISRGTSTIALTNTNVWYPIISLRLKSTHLGATIQPDFFTVIPSASTTFEVALILNPTVAGVDAASWQGITNSAVEFDISRTTTNSLTNGFFLSRHILSQTNQSTPITTQFNNILTIGSKVNGTRDEVVMAIRRYTGTAADVYASLNWREVL